MGLLSAHLLHKLREVCVYCVGFVSASTETKPFPHSATIEHKTIPRPKKLCELLVGVTRAYNAGTYSGELLVNGASKITNDPLLVKGTVRTDKQTQCRFQIACFSKLLLDHWFPLENLFPTSGELFPNLMEWCSLMVQVP